MLHRLQLKFRSPPFINWTVIDGGLALQICHRRTQSVWAGEEGIWAPNLVCWCPTLCLLSPGFPKELLLIVPQRWKHLDVKEKWPERLRRYAPTKENLVEPYLNNDQHQSASVIINQYQSAPASRENHDQIKKGTSQLSFRKFVEVNLICVIFPKAHLKQKFQHREKHVFFTNKLTQNLVLQHLMWNGQQRTSFENICLCSLI